MLSIHDIIQCTGGKVIQEGRGIVRVSGVSIDSRTLKKGYAFVAIKGDRCDGHDFIQQAVKKGVSVILVSKRVSVPVSGRVAVIRVKDTTKALGLMASQYRRQFDIPIIAVTGSAGKTTAKDMIAAVLNKKYKILKSNGSENNQYGVPLTLFRLNRSHQMAVLEVGTNQSGDIDWLGKIIQPTTAVFTNVGPSHLKGLKSAAGVFHEKSKLLHHLAKGGIVIYNTGDDYLKKITKKICPGTVIRYGRGCKADYRADHIKLEKNHQLRFNVNSHEMRIKNPAVHNIDNALAAISCGCLYKIRYNEINSALSRFKFIGGRHEVIKTGRIWLIDDTYNSNPISFESAVQTLHALKICGKKVVVCSDMLELGNQARQWHQKMGRMMAKTDISEVMTIGRYARFINQGVQDENNRIVAGHYDHLASVHRRLKQICGPGDAVLVKGSRGMHMERTVQFLKKQFIE